MDYKFETVNCNLCNSDNHELISKKGLYGLPTNVVICKDCGLCYLNPRWDHDSYLHFYRYEYDTYYRPKIATKTPVRDYQNNPIIIRLKQFKLLPEEAACILDIGSGEGQNLVHFKSLFPESQLYAIEPSVEAQFHLEKYEINLIGTDVDATWDLNHKDQFDIIIMRHVLEHFLDPLKILKKVSSVLTHSGFVYIAVPNNLNPISHLEKAWFRNVHTYYFNKYSLENICALAGLEILALVEGDNYNKGEVYMVAKKSNTQRSPNFSILHYEEQMRVLKKKSREDKSLIIKLTKLFKKAKKKMKNFLRPVLTEKGVRFLKRLSGKSSNNDGSGH